MAEEKDGKLVTALRQAKQQPMLFAFVAKGTTEGVLMVSKKKIPVKEVNEAKTESGGKKVIRGRCQFIDGKIVFETAKEPPSVLAKQLKAVIHESAGMMLQVETRVAPDLEDEEDEKETGEIPQAPLMEPSPSGQVPPAPPLPGGQDPSAARFGQRFKAIAPVMKRLEPIQNQPAKDARQALNEANDLFRANNFADANETLDAVEGLIKEAFAEAQQAGNTQGNVTPQAPPQQPQDEGAVRFTSRLKAIAPVMQKAETTGSDFARQAKFEIAEANKLFIAKQYNEANAGLDKAEKLIKQAFAGTSQPNQKYQAALVGYQSTRTQAVNRLRDLAKEVAAEDHPDAAKAQIEIRGVIAQLSEAPASTKDVASLQRYLIQDDVVFDVCELAYDFRTPLLKSLDELQSTFN